MDSISQIKPSRVLKIILISMTVLLVLALLFPKEGVKIFGKTYHFVHVEDIVEKGTSNFKAEDWVANSLDGLQNEFSRLASLSNEAAAMKGLEMANTDSNRILFSNEQRDDLDLFFESLYNIPTTGEQVRVIHYGDSQIEEDRITSYIRRELQARFGGGGLGMVSALPIAGTVSSSHAYSNNWKRYTSFSLTGEPLSNNRYGTMGITCKYVGNANGGDFLKVPVDTINSGENILEKEQEVFEVMDKNRGYLTIRPTDKSNPKLFEYNRIRVFLGNVTENIQLNVTTNNGQFQENITAGLDYKDFTFSFANSPSNVSITFSGGASPEVYGVSLESSSGVVVDNIPMRGSAGSGIVKFQQSLAKSMFTDLNPRLIILQYGGNALPGISGVNSAKSYGKQMTNTIKFIRRFCPNAAILFIGPADMCKTVNGQLQTYPMMETMIDELKLMAEENNVAYFDMYRSMGGKNSMIQWKKEGWASSDYIHFNRKGAEKMSEILFKNLMFEYELYLLRTNKKVSE